ncbi:MAG: NAD(P)-dependent oxidoreductase [Hyphomicrobiales bacterium]
MGNGTRRPDIAAGRLSASEYAENFSDLHPLLSEHEALVEADRCYFCHDAPCVTACPTSIDIPMFIRQILTSNPQGAAKTIFDQNIMGGMCARVCPTETLCEEACVRNECEEKPVLIGQLQRFATDHAMERGVQPFTRGADTGRKVAVVGAGPAGLACAHRLSLHGHTATIFEAREKPGGLNEFGIAAYKTIDNFARREVEFILSIGGIDIQYGKALGEAITLEGLKNEYDAVFLSVGLAGANGLGIDGEEAQDVEDAVEFIADVRQADDLSKLPVGRKVVVIGGGMTAIDAGVQAKLLGAEDVTIAYRRGKDRMNASLFEQDLAQTKGVKIKHNVQPVAIVSDDNGALCGIELEYTQSKNGKLAGTGETFVLDADTVLRAIGQKLAGEPVNGAGGVELDGRRIKVDDEGRTSLAGVWAGGDCVAGGDDLTVSAVEDGKVAAESINRALTG